MTEMHETILKFAHYLASRRGRAWRWLARLGDRIFRRRMLRVEKLRDYPDGMEFLAARVKRERESAYLQYLYYLNEYRNRLEKQVKENNEEVIE